MEEASVAGESPDRSKQRESSGEPTPGSASPVPEARSSSPDPRLAVARESVSLGGVDTATRIFSVRDLPKASEEAEESPAEAEEAEESPAEPESTPEAPEPTDEAPEATEKPSEAADTAPDAEEASRDGDERLREAVAKWVTKTDGGTKPEPAAAEAKDDAPAPETETPPADEEHDLDTDEPDSPGARGTARPAPTGDRAAAADEEHDLDSDEPDSPGARGTARPAPTDPQPDDDDQTAAADEAHDLDSDEPDSPGARGTARPAPTDPQTDDDDQAPETDADGQDDAAPEDEEPPVDQPTAVFKAPRPPVDQPTTMLKLGKPAPETKPEPKPEPKPDPKPQPEADAERTSKFVALKPLDEPRPKPEVTAAVPQVGPERTTQQPLPPKPPLDLLAELTNTPPPPPSPLRTVARRVKIWTPLVLLLIVAFAIAQSMRPLPSPTLALTAEDSYTFDGGKVSLPWPTQGQGWMDVNGIGTMSDFGKQTPVAIGSVAKAMTAYIVLKDHPLKSGEEGAKIKVDALAEKEGGYNKQGESTLNTVKEGDVLTERQAIAAIMIPSANNIARLLARWDAGSEAAFIKKMNDTAKELGMKNTTYTDASGLKETTVSSAEDQVKLGNELVKIPALMEITSMGQWIDPSGQKWYNYNYLVPYTGIGIKTGTTSAAGGNLLFAARKKVDGETVTVVGAILGQHKAPIIKTVNDVSKVALLAAEDQLKSAKILKKGDVVGYVDDGLGGHTPVVLTKDVTAVGWSGFKVKLSFAADDVPHTAKAGTKVGTLTVGDGEGGAVKVPVTLQKDLTEPGFTDKLTRVS
ncbi:D-alanyl-D-alanine carboxypeptidase [Streptomyces griseorubiginosus]|uniref:serine-type D-Ala-D-Ala carboxypeptidase n=1 Tax=Streptomyces griseorubiginosus TaxID=67304 RepID=A0A101RRB6_9ACTN|nr:D-alanyl-D-alanine carboxypeptidase [Streptomyces griseorubiginosus]KUN60307.1 D-alanyl-D-alanine carboxypeptidase [Streptomyces griseorubiginosus]